MRARNRNVCAAKSKGYLLLICHTYGFSQTVDEKKITLTGISLVNQAAYGDQGGLKGANLHTSIMLDPADCNYRDACTSVFFEQFPMSRYESKDRNTRDAGNVAYNQNVYLVGDNGRLLRSTDSGKTWTRRTFSNSFKLDDETLLSNGQLMEKEKLLSQIPVSGKINSVAQSIDKKTLLAVGDKGGAYLETNASGNWKKLTGLPDASFVAVFLNQTGNKIWIADADGNIFKSANSGLSFSHSKVAN